MAEVDFERLQAAVDGAVERVREYFFGKSGNAEWRVMSENRIPEVAIARASLFSKILMLQKEIKALTGYVSINKNIKYDYAIFSKLYDDLISFDEVLDGFITENAIDDLCNLLEKFVNILSNHPGVSFYPLMKATFEKEEALFQDLKSKIDSVNDQVSRIREADGTVTALQADIASMKENVSSISIDARAKLKDFETLVVDLEENRKKYAGLNTEVTAVLQKANEALSAATTLGLMKGFNDQAEKQAGGLVLWVVLLVVALLLGGGLGASHFAEIRPLLLNKEVSESRIAMVLLMSALSLAPSVWFAWLATKQIGQRFRLGQDYLFKAAAASAFEGYSGYVQGIKDPTGDRSLERQLVKSLLDRFDEHPLRLIDDAAHGSPMHELGGKGLETAGKAFETAADVVGKTAEAVGKGVGKVMDAAKDVAGKAGDAKAGDKP